LTNDVSPVDVDSSRDWSYAERQQYHMSLNRQRKIDAENALGVERQKLKFAMTVHNVHFCRNAEMGVKRYGIEPFVAGDGLVQSHVECELCDAIELRLHEKYALERACRSLEKRSGKLLGRYYPRTVKKCRFCDSTFTLTQSRNAHTKKFHADGVVLKSGVVVVRHNEGGLATSSSMRKYPTWSAEENEWLLLAVNAGLSRAVMSNFLKRSVLAVTGQIAKLNRERWSHDD
jgi:hypothetical protein